MPIGELLAQITGEKPAPSLSTARPTIAPKRKADGDARNGAPKALRTTASSAARPLASQAVPSTPTFSSRPVDGRPAPQTDLRLPGGSHTSRSNTTAARQPIDRVQSGRVTKSRVPARPTLPAAASPQAPLKKGSFAEIMARAKMAQETMGQVGGIRHKPIDQSMKQEAGAGKPPLGKTGPSPANGHAKRAHSTAAAPRSGVTGKNATEGQGKKNASKSQPPEPVKKVKKAVFATIGYTGTARPKAVTTPQAKKPDAATRAGLINPHAPRTAPRPGPGKPRNTHYADHGDDDDDMDDFIDYDEEEEEGTTNRRYDYDSDASSDMEAGLDDIDNEEQYAARVARQEDEKEEVELRRAKLLKERRKQEFERRMAQR